MAWRFGRGVVLAILLGGLGCGTAAGDGWQVQFEEARYEVSWGLVPAGIGMFRATPLKDGGVALRAQICSNSFVDAIHSVRDQIYTRAVADGGELRPVYHRVTQIEGGDRKETITQFTGDGRAYVRKRNKTKVVDVPAAVKDTLTAIYAIRRLPLKVGATYRLPLLDGDDLKTLVVPVTGRTEVAGESVLEIYPHTEQADQSKGQDEWTLLLTDDERRIPVRMKLALSFGKLHLKLKKVRTEPRGDDPREMFCDPDVRMPR